MQTELYPLGCPVIVDSLAYEREDRHWTGDLEPHQYVGNISGVATMFDDGGWPTTLYIVRLCSPDRFEDPKKPNGAHISNLLATTKNILFDSRDAANAEVQS